MSGCCRDCQGGHTCRGQRADVTANRSGDPVPEDLGDRALPLLASMGSVDALVPFVQGAGAEQVQLAVARRRSAEQFTADPSARSLRGPGGGRRTAVGDLTNPQVFVAHPRIVAMVDPAIAGALPHLPGRSPFAGWDGEPGAAAPFGVDA